MQQVDCWYESQEFNIVNEMHNELGTEDKIIRTRITWNYKSYVDKHN